MGGGKSGVVMETVEAISISVMHVPTIKIHKIKTGTMFFSLNFLLQFSFASPQYKKKKFSLYTFNHGF